MRHIGTGLAALGSAAGIAVSAAILLGGTVQPAMAAKPPIVIGATISETGAFAEDAGYQIKGMELAVHDANAHGGWLGRKLVLKVYDDKSSPGEAVRLYTRLITDEHVNLLIGPYSSGVTQAIAPLINKYQMATIEPGASMPDLYRKGNKWNIQGTPPSTTYLDELLPDAKKDGAKTMAIMALKSAFTLACEKARLAQAKKLGIKVVYQTQYSLPAPDFSAIGLAIKQAHPDVVLACTYFPDAVGFVKALHDQGFAPRFFGETVGPVEGAFGKAVGPLANGIISNTSWWYNFKTPGSQKVVAEYKAKYHEMPDYHAMTGYAAVQVLGAAVQGSKSLNQAKIRHWMLHNTPETVTGKFKVNANGLNEGSQYMVQWQNNEMKLLTPAKYAQAKLQVPYTGK